MDMLLINNGTSLLVKLQQLLFYYSKEINLSTVDYKNLMRDDINAFDLVILSGTSLHSPNESKHLQLIQYELVTTSNSPIIGICYGAQLIADAYGGHVDFIGESIKGMHSVIFTDNSLLRIWENH